MTTEKMIRGGQCCEAPAVKSIEIHSEGLLCQSGNFGINDWQTDDDELNI